MSESVSDSAVLAAAATKLTEPSEGFRNYPYQDSAGVWTIGIGSTRDAAGNPITAATPPVTEAQALQLLERDMRAALATVEHDVAVPLTEGEEAALVDFVYNEGAGNFLRSTVLRCLNAGDYAGACAHLADWDMAGGCAGRPGAAAGAGAGGV